MNLETQKHTKRIQIHQSQSQTLTFWTRLSKVLFPKRSVKMIDGNEKRKRQLVFEFKSSRVYEKRSKNWFSYFRQEEENLQHEVAIKHQTALVNYQRQLARKDNQLIQNK